MPLNLDTLFCVILRYSKTFSRRLSLIVLNQVNVTLFHIFPQADISQSKSSVLKYIQVPVKVRVIQSNIDIKVLQQSLYTFDITESV